MGRYLDLHAHYLALINAKFGKKDLEYYEYVAGLATHTSAIPRTFKAGTAYRWDTKRVRFERRGSTQWRERGGSCAV